MRVGAFLMMVSSLAPVVALGGEKTKADLQARAAELQDALAKALSPGSIAMLIDYGDAPEAQERLRSALRDPRSETRAAAARVVSVLGVARLMPDLLRALEAEQDMDAAREELRAVATLGGTEADPALFAAASRLRGDLLGVLIDVLGRRWGASLEPRAEDTTPKAGQSNEPRGNAAGRTSLTLAASGALRAKDERLFEVVLTVARATKIDVDIGIFQGGLQSEIARTREATCWHLALIDPKRLPSELKEEVTTSTCDDIASSFACEVVARILGRPVTDRGDWMAGLDQDAAKRVPIARVVLMHLTPGERKALSNARADATDVVDKLLEQNRRQGRHAHNVGVERGAGGRTRGEWLLDLTQFPGVFGLARGVRLLDLTAFPGGFVPDVLAVTGCATTASEKWGQAEVAYDRDGRPRTVTLINGLKGLENCKHAERLLLMSGLAPSQGAGGPGSKQVVLVRLDRDSLACLASATTGKPGDEEERIVAGPPVAGGRIRAPKKIRDVRPVYPEWAKSERAQGKVILEAVISRSGCIGGLEVVRGVHPALNAAALRAASGWRYTPALLDGKAVPVIMTVAVNFSLSDWRYESPDWGFRPPDYQ